MPLFSNPFDVDVEKATSEMNTSEDWALMLDICDKAKQNQTASKNCLKSILRRVFNKNPHVALQALSLLNACVKNSGKTFQLEVASRDFITDCKKIISEENMSVASRKVSTQLKQHLKNWSENEFKSDSALSIIPGFYKSLKDEGINFATEEQPKSKKFSKDPNVVQSQEEEDDIARAIALSLKESEKFKVSNSFQPPSTTSSIYPSVRSQSPANSHSILKQKEPKKVRALYDFEAVEDNELTFKAGEIIGVTDDSDQNWWKGVSWRGEGLFPANFVTFSLEAQDEEKEELPEHKDENVELEAEVVVLVNKIDEGKIDATLAMLQNADPTGDVNSDPENMVQFEEQCRKMLPLIDQELEKIDREHSRLTEMNDKLMRSLELYHALMAELPSASKVSDAMVQQQQQQLEQQMMQLQQQMTQLGQMQQQATVAQYQTIPASHLAHHLPSSLQQQPHNIETKPDQVAANHMTMPQNFQPQNLQQQQQPAYAQQYNYNSLSSYAEMYLGTNGNQVNINSIPAMTGSHLPADDTTAAK